MHVVPKDRRKLGVMRRAILRIAETSRFRLKCYIEDDEIRVKNVRLREKKDYCGQHPGPCPVNPFFNKKHLHGTWLEGADWVGLNDMLNSLFDRYSWEADIWSASPEFKGKMRVRRGRLRRVRYEAYEEVRTYGTVTVVVMGWKAHGTDADFEDRCRQKPKASEYPDGTPGEAAWKPKRRRKAAAAA